jgi:two-component system, NtrC family, sensor kinase
MKRRSRAGGEPIKGWRGKTPKPRRRNVPKDKPPLPEYRLLSRELSEAREQQAATSEVLKAISRSTFDLRTVLDTLLQSAIRLCSADQGTVAQRKGDTFYRSVSYGFPPAYLEYVKDVPVEPGRDTGTGRALLEGKVIHIPDVLADPDFTWNEGQRLGGFRTVLGVPMLREDVAVGVLALTRSAVRPFSDEQIALVQNFADQAVIAMENGRLLNELRQRTTDLTEALEQQTATSDLLKAISGSPGNLEPVFQAMLENAVGICGANFGNMFLYEDDAFRTVAMFNAPEAYANARMGAPLHPPSDSGLGRLVATKEVVQIADLSTVERYVINRDPFVVAAVELAGIRTLLAVPMLKERHLVGAIVIYRQEVRPFGDKQTELVKNFASQVVIAIENGRLLNELRQRTTDLTEALEQQTATSEVLQIISSSPGDLQPVFATMLENATRICDAKFGNVYLWDSDAFHLVATHNTPPAFAESRERGPFRPNSGHPFRNLVETKEAFHVADVAALQAYKERDPQVVETVELGGIRTCLGVPMLKDNNLIGALVIFRQEVRPFSDKQIALLTNFAAQAVIAIENTRLLNELRQRTTDLTERTTDLTEALEQQTATSEVLQVISSSPGDLEPVFASILKNAVRICDATFGNIYRWDGEALHIVATHNTPAAFAEDRRRSPYRPYPQSPIGRMVADKTVAHIRDVTAEEVYTAQNDPVAVSAVALGGIRTLLGVPLLNKDEMIGAFFLSRQEVRPFTEKQIALVKNFAAQAVIAIENARLLNELRQRTADLAEALEQQTATSEVLQVISGSPGDLQPVFAAMLENAARICDANFGNIFRWDGDALWLVATHNTPPAFIEHRRRVPFRPNQGNPIGDMLKANAAIHVADLARDERYIQKRDPEVVAAVDLGGIRTFVAVPMLKDEKLIGAVILYRQEVRPFSNKQIELVKNFAAQAVIAIENARLLNELRQSLEQQTATADVLKVISRSTFDLQMVLDTLVASAAQLCRAERASITIPKGQLYHRVASYGFPSEFREYLDGHPLAIERGNIVGRVVLEGRTIQIDDVEADPEFTFSEASRLARVRTLLGVPLMRQESPVGVLVLARTTVEPFTDRQIELVETFADQAVIAMENARLLKELRERTEQVEAQSQEVVKLNQQLEQRVADQVGEIERMSRLRRFLPPQVADLIVASGSEKQLESHRREITALFCDLRGFTGFSESADPEDVMTLLREYHEAIGESIIKYSGTLERYAGDGVMVVFNDPVPVENPALQAVLMALEMRDAIAALTETWRRWGHDIGFGIGIAHGFATLGTIGFEGRFDYAAIGTVSNVASRLCDEAKPGQILISPRVLTKVENSVKVEPVGKFELKGIRRPLAAYNVVAVQSSLT